MEKDSKYYYELGLEAAECGNLKEAIRFLLVSLQMMPHFKTHHELAKLYKELDDQSNAILHFADAYMMNPKSDKIAYDYANYLYDNQKKEQAEKICREILQRNSTYKPATKLLDKINNRGSGLNS